MDATVTGPVDKQSESEDRVMIQNPMLASPVGALSPEAFEKLCKSIMIIMPRQRNVAGEMMHLTAIWGRLGLVFADCVDEQGGFIEIARALVERTFLQYSDAHPEVRHLVMVDSDEQFSWDAPLRLAQWDLPIVTGVVCGYSPQRGVFACFMDYDENGVARFPCYEHTKFLPDHGIKKIHAAGGGLISIRRDVLETLLNKGELPFLIPEDLRRESYRQGTCLQGEDMSLCAKAREHGFDTYVDFGVRAFHYKMLKLGWPESGLDEDLDAKDWKVSPMDYRGPR